MLRTKAIALAFIALIALSVPAAAYGQQYVSSTPRRIFMPLGHAKSELPDGQQPLHVHSLTKWRHFLLNFNSESTGVRDLLLNNIESNNQPEQLIKVVGYFTPEELRLSQGWTSGQDSS